MRELTQNILIAGAGASQEIYGNRLANSSMVPEGLDLSIIFYDPNPDVKLRDDLTHLRAGVREGRVRLVHTLPDEQFDTAIIATSSQYHADAAIAVLQHQERTPLFVLEKPVAASYEDLARFREAEERIQPRSIINEPYFAMGSIAQLVERVRNRPDNPVTEVCVWSSKTRRIINPHGELGIYAIELPHLHGAASWIAGQTLSTDAVQDNIYYADIQGTKGNDGNYIRFEANGMTVHVAQGLGKFIMDQYGKMTPHQNPPRTRRINLRFADGSSSLLDIEPAFPFTASNKAARAMTYHHYKDGRVRVVGTLEDPREKMINYILRRVQNPELPNVPGVSLSEALERNLALLNLRSSAEVIYGS